jgi:hypothetical protein
MGKLVIINNTPKSIDVWDCDLSKTTKTIPEILVRLGYTLTLCTAMYVDDINISYKGELPL